nr:hypothetical protein [Acetivibrio ethanolgignens]
MEFSDRNSVHRGIQNEMQFEKWHLFDEFRENHHRILKKLKSSFLIGICDPRGVSKTFTMIFKTS